MMAFEDVPVWSTQLEALAEGKRPLECPSCGEDASYEPMSVTPGDPAMRFAGARPLPLPSSTGGSTSDALPLLFGRVTCPRCQQRFDIPGAFL